jgi:branched-chain amino acid transport system ATP-binding protein
VTTVPLRLEALGVSVHFAGIKAVEGVDLHLEEGEILGLIGPNGAGKTTLVNALSGFQRPTTGTVWIGGIETTDWKPDRCAPPRRVVAAASKSSTTHPIQRGAT